MTNNFPTLGPIVIGVRSIEKSKDFYVNVFGLKISQQSMNYLSGFLKDATHIEIEENSDERFPKWEERNIGTFKNSQLIVADVFNFLEQVEKYGGKTVSPPVQRTWGEYGAEFSDPDENIFLVSQG